jgi:pimeloyl-ACP methyl ester carboxylesterase
VTTRSVVIGIAVLVLTAGPATPSDEMRVVSIPVGEASIEVHDRGTGTPVVLLPGSGGDASSFDGFAPLLNAAGFRTVAISWRAAGRSTGPLKGLTLHDYARDVAAVIDALKLAPAHILGRTGGNRIARCLATDRPDLVRSVILIAAGGLVPGDPKAIAMMDDWWFARVPEEQQIVAFETSMLSPSTPRGKIRPPTTWARAGAAFDAADEATPVSEWWTAGRAPILVIQGLNDVIAPPGNGRALCAQLGARAKLVELPDAGHALLLELPERIAQEVVSFLQDQS